MRRNHSNVKCSGFPAHVAAGWLGHSGEIARKHYLMTTEDHFRKAAGPVAHFVAPQDTATKENELQPLQEPAISGPLQDAATHVNMLVPLRGTESADVTSSNSNDLRKMPKAAAAKSGTISPVSDRLDPELRHLIRIWSQVPASVRTAIMAIVRAVGAGR